jgi:hypothetical protein
MRPSDGIAIRTESLAQIPQDNEQNPCNVIPSGVISKGLGDNLVLGMVSE